MRLRFPELTNALRNLLPGRLRPLRALEGDRDLLGAGIPLDSASHLYSPTPARVLSLIAEADTGDPRRQAAAFLDMLEAEPIFAGHLQTRRLAVMSCPWQVVSPSAPKLAEEETEMLRRAGLTRAIGALADAVGTGYAGCAVDWEPGCRSIRGFLPVAPDRWVFDDGGNPALSSLAGEDVPLSAYPAGQFLFVTATGRTGLPSRQGVLRTLLWLYCFKHATLKEWTCFLEKFGVPFMIGKLPSGQYNDARLRGDLLRAIQSIRSGGGGVATTESEVQAINAMSSANTDAFERFQRYCDELATLVILGQLASSDHAGGLSRGTAQEAVRQDLLAADCENLVPAIQRLVVAHLRLSGRRVPADLAFRIEHEIPEDLARRAERDRTLAEASGCLLDRDYVIQTYGVRLSERQAAPAQPSGGQAGAAFSDGAQGALPRDAGTPRTSPATSAGDILRAALSSLADPESLAAFDAAIGAAAEAAFAGLDPASPTLADDFRGRLPALMDALPQVFAALDPAEAAEAIQGAMLAAFLNGALPPDFWRRRPAPDGTPGSDSGSSPTGGKSSTPGTTTGSSSPRRSTRRSRTP